MAKFRKTILKANRTYRSPDGEVFVDADRLKHWAGSFQSMKSKGLHVPVSWDHSDDPTRDVPLALSSTAKRKRPPEGVVGYLDDVKLSADGDSAEITLDIRGSKNIEQVENNLASVSPVIRKEWKDGDGTDWSDIWGHMDLVQHPVDHNQSEFKPVESIACALRMGLDDGKPETYRLADDEEQSTDDGTEAAPGVMIDTSRVKKVIEALSRMQIIVPDDTTIANFFDRVEAALLTAAAMGGEEMADTETLEEVRPAETAAMSTEARNEIETLRKQLKAKDAHADKQHQQTITQRLSTLLEQGQCTAAEHKDKTNQVQAVRLSLDEEGNHHPSQLEAWIESREAVPPGTFLDGEARTRMAGLVEQPHPDSGEETPESAQEVADFVFGVKK